MASLLYLFALAPLVAAQDLSIHRPLLQSVDNSKTTLGPCANDLQNLCGITLSDSTDYFSSRMCLKEMSDKTSSQCKVHVEEKMPSIIEPCYAEIKKFCTKTQPGANRIHECLDAKRNDLTVRCASAMDKERAQDMPSFGKNNYYGVVSMQRSDGNNIQVSSRSYSGVPSTLSSPFDIFSQFFSFPSISFVQYDKSRGASASSTAASNNQDDENDPIDKYADDTNDDDIVSSSLLSNILSRFFDSRGGLVSVFTPTTAIARNQPCGRTGANQAQDQASKPADTTNYLRRPSLLSDSMSAQAPHVSAVPMVRTTNIAAPAIAAVGTAQKPSTISRVAILPAVTRVPLTEASPEEAQARATAMGSAPKSIASISTTVPKLMFAVPFAPPAASQALPTSTSMQPRSAALVAGADAKAFVPQARATATVIGSAPKVTSSVASTTLPGPKPIFAVPPAASQTLPASASMQPKSSALVAGADAKALAPHTDNAAAPAVSLYRAKAAQVKITATVLDAPPAAHANHKSSSSPAEAKAVPAAPTTADAVSVAATHAASGIHAAARSVYAHTEALVSSALERINGLFQPARAAAIVADPRF